MACDPKIVRLSLELGLAVNDYNAGLVDKLDDVIRTTLQYLAEVKGAYANGLIKEEELGEFFALVGQSWASVHGFHRGKQQVQPEAK
jgi:hypothetical protein